MRAFGRFSGRLLVSWYGVYGSVALIGVVVNITYASALGSYHGCLTVLTELRTNTKCASALSLARLAYRCIVDTAYNVRKVHYFVVYVWDSLCKECVLALHAFSLRCALTFGFGSPKETSQRKRNSRACVGCVVFIIMHARYATTKQMKHRSIGGGKLS